MEDEEVDCQIIDRPMTVTNERPLKHRAYAIDHRTRLSVPQPLISGSVQETISPNS